MLKIGEFSKLSRISVRMLRHYDEIGLLKPAQVDPFTDYRYYREDQLPTAGRIAALKDMGFSLADIVKILEIYDDREKLERFFSARRRELEALSQDYNTFYHQAPALSEYLVYTGLGQRLSFSSYLDGVWAGGNVRSFKDSGFDPNSDVNINTDALNYNTPGIYPVTYQLSRVRSDGSREYLGVNTLYVIVEG